jgi:hypothetical protein
MNCVNCDNEIKSERERNNERSKQYYKEHREEILSKLNTEENRNRIHEYNKQYYERNKEKILNRVKSRELTPEQIAERKLYMKKYREQKKVSMTEEEIERRRVYMKEYRQKMKKVVN